MRVKKKLQTSLLVRLDLFEVINEDLAAAGNS